MHGQQVFVGRRVRAEVRYRGGQPRLVQIPRDGVQASGILGVAAGVVLQVERVGDDRYAGGATRLLHGSTLAEVAGKRVVCPL